MHCSRLVDPRAEGDRKIARAAGSRDAAECLQTSDGRVIVMSTPGTVIATAVARSVGEDKPSTAPGLVPRLGVAVGRTILLRVLGHMTDAWAKAGRGHSGKAPPRDVAVGYCREEAGPDRMPWARAEGERHWDEADLGNSRASDHSAEEDMRLDGVNIDPRVGCAWDWEANRNRATALRPWADAAGRMQHRRMAGTSCRRS